MDFDALPDTARIWIYQASRAFSPEEADEIRLRLSAFLTEWTAHGSSLRAGFELPYNRFIVIGLDQNSQAASGCSIDASVHFIQELERQFDIVLLDRMNVTYKQGDYIAYKPLDQFRKMAKDRAVSPKTVVFNNLVNNKYEYRQDWEVPASESWHKRFF